MYASGDGSDRGLLEAVWNSLSDGKFELILANAAHIKNVAGRKADLNGATWIADLTAFGLIKASFVPGEAIQELR
jgi:transposase